MSLVETALLHVDEMFAAAASDWTAGPHGSGRDALGVPELMPMLFWWATRVASAATADATVEGTLAEILSCEGMGGS